MNKAGRLAFVKSVLSAMPIHQLVVLAPPKKTLKLLEKIERGLLWAGRAKANSGNCQLTGGAFAGLSPWVALVSTTWSVPDSSAHALAMASCVDDGRGWSCLDAQFSREERAFFFASTTTMVGNGQRALFWEDRWINGPAIGEIAPLVYACIPKRHRKPRMVEASLHENR
uniref:Uncharacterized protein n=1 Tax=Aegilops tauschii subsp. strangulata TaxID=200361 RepID=A0A453RPF2_AEGTS